MFDRGSDTRSVVRPCRLAPLREGPKDFGIEPDRAAELDRRMRSTLRGYPEIRPLQKMLLDLGGWSVLLPAIEEDLSQLLREGRIFPTKGRVMKKGRPSKCHENAARLWDANTKLLRIVTGYALAKDGIWRQHSWCVWKDDCRVVETTERYTAYFGCILSNEQSREFWELNAL